MYNRNKLLVQKQIQFQMIEIERKFLVTSDTFKEEAFSQNRIKQGYLSSIPDRTVHSHKGDKAYITIKECQMKQACPVLSGKKKFL
jgi:adenylate cyclase